MCYHFKLNSLFDLLKIAKRLFLFKKFAFQSTQDRQAPSWKVKICALALMFSLSFFIPKKQHRANSPLSPKDSFVSCCGFFLWNGFFVRETNVQWTTRLSMTSNAEAWNAFCMHARLSDTWKQPMLVFWETFYFQKRHLIIQHFYLTRLELLINHFFVSSWFQITFRIILGLEELCQLSTLQKTQFCNCDFCLVHRWRISLWAPNLNSQLLPLFLLSLTSNVICFHFFASVSKLSLKTHFHFDPPPSLRWFCVSLKVVRVFEFKLSFLLGLIFPWRKTIF